MVPVVVPSITTLAPGSPVPKPLSITRPEIEAVCALDVRGFTKQKNVKIKKVLISGNRIGIWNFMMQKNPNSFK